MKQKSTHQKEGRRNGANSIYIQPIHLFFSQNNYVLSFNYSVECVIDYE